MEQVRRKPPIRFRKDITRSFIDYHVWRAIADHTLHGQVLNISGGTRTYAPELARFAGNSMVVTDWPESPTRNRVSVFCDAHQLPFGGDTFDSVLCTEVLEHLREPREAMREIYRVLKNGGSLLLTTPFQYQAHQRPFDFFRFTYDGLDLMSREAGFEDVTVMRRGDSFGVALNALKIFVRLRRFPGSDRLVEQAERLYVRWFGPRSLLIPLARDPMALGYTVIACKNTNP